MMIMESLSSETKLPSTLIALRRGDGLGELSQVGKQKDTTHGYKEREQGETHAQQQKPY